MLLRDLSGFLNGVECISEYKLSPFLLYGFLFQEKRIQAYLVFLKDMFGNIFLIDIGHVLKDGKLPILGYPLLDGRQQAPV